MRNIFPKIFAFLAVVSAMSLVVSSHAQVVWAVGRDDNGWPVGNGGGPDATFVQEAGTNPLPGNPANPEVDQQADDDYYFAGVYSTVIAGNGSYVPVGVVAANEEAAERAFAGTDNDLRYHFNLPSTLRPFDLLSVTFDAFNLHGDGGADPRYGVEVYFNGVLVQTQVIVRAAQLDTDITSPQFTLASVNAQTGPGADNIVYLKGINYNADGGGNWMGIDYVQLNSAPGKGLLPNSVNIGQNKIGSVTEDGEGDFTIVGGGNDIWDQRDEFTYAYTEVTGDFDVQVRVASLTANGTHSKAGIMVRETLSEFSRMAFPRVTPDQAPGVNDVRFAYRTGLDNVSGVNGGQHEDGGGTPNNIPNAWLRLSRIGNVLYASNSIDGAAWTLLGSQDTATWGGGALSNKLFVGLAVCRNGAGPTATAEFRDFQFNTNGSPFTLVGASSRGNPTGIRVTYNQTPGDSALTPGNYVLNTLSGPNVTVVTGLRFTTANDSPARDPMTFTLEGTLGDPYTGPWTLIASGNTGLSTDRFATAPDVTFANSTAYKAYRILFPTVRDAAAANSMQISEVAFLDASATDVTAPGDLVIPTSGNHPGGEAAPLAIDDNTATKYLNFDKLNTGFTVVPTAGTTPGAPTVTAASVGAVPGTIQLTTGTPLVEGATYELAVDAVLSQGGAALENVLTSFTHGAGFEVRRIHVTHNKTDDSGYYRISDAVNKGIGDVVSLGDGVFPPVQSNTVFEDPIPDTGANERFSSRMAGILQAPANGNYTFYISSDDQGLLFLSSDQNPANKVQIASEPAWNGPRQYISGDNQASRGTPPANISAPQTLAAGGRYYLEMIFTEGGGGNNGSATWLPPGGPAVVNGSSPIPESAFVPSRLFGGFSFRTLGPVQIVSQPATQTVTALTPTTFRVGVDGTPNYTFQWRRNGVPIPGATDSTYTIPVTQLEEDGASFSVVVANEFSSATSASATLTVLVPQSPHLTGVTADATFSRVTVTFDNRVLASTAEDIGNYEISGGVTITSATRDATGRRVTLTTSALGQGVPYTLTVSDIRDETGTTMLDPNPTITNFTGWVFSPGFAMMEVYPTGGGNAVSVLTSHPSYPNSPSERFFITAIDSRQGYPNDSHEAYGGRISGLFIPPTNGNYILSLRSDDASELWMSPDSSTAGLAKIAEQTGCCNAFTQTPPLASAPTALVAGERYAFQVLWKEGTGGDYAQVSIDALNVVPASMIGTFANPDAVSIVITQQPASVTRDVNGFASFSVGASLSVFDGIPRALLYQWRSNGVDIAGATGSTYTAPQLTVDNDGDVYTVLVRAPGAQVLSSDAVVTVQADETPPVLLSARADLSFNTIRLTFSELMDSGPMDPGNYTLLDSAMNQIFVSTTEHTTNQNRSVVLLRLASPLTVGGVYELEVDFQADLAGNTTVGSGNPVIDPNGVVTNVYAFAQAPGYVLKELYMGLSTTGVAVSELTSSPKYPDSPDIVRYGDLLELNTFDEFEGYGARLRGWLTPPTTGNYTFYIASDDNGQFWLSTDADPANKVNIANEPVWSGRRTWVGEAGGGSRLSTPSPSGGPQANISGPIPLVAGQSYYFEALVKEGGGGDNLAVAWKPPGGSDPVNGSSPIPGQYMSALADLSGATITITQPPTNRAFAGTTTAFAPDFNANDGGFFVTIPAGQGYAGPWHWEVSSGSWREDGQGPETGHPNTSILNSPALTVKETGNVALTIDHRHSFEDGSWDGGQVRMSVNGGAYTAVPGAAFSQNGYNGTVLPNSTSVLAGQEAFVNASAGYGAGTFITSIAGGAFNQGDVIRLQFIAGNDGNTAGGVPDWEINSMGSTGLDAYLGNTEKTVTFSVAATSQNFLGANQGITYQWSRDDGTGFVAIPGATGPSYTFAPAPSDDGAQFQVTVSVIGASVTSSAATLTLGTPATLQIQRSAGQITISWSGSLCLEEADAITGPWGPSARVNGVPFTPPTTGNKYYRLATCPP